MEVGSITFGILSADEILKMSVCEVKEASKNKFQGVGTVYDERMGPIEMGILCSQCGKHTLECGGHFGHIKLNYPIIHPLHYKLVLNILKCMCFNCYRVIVTQRVLDTEKIENDLTSIVKYVEKNRVCFHCAHVHPKLILIQDSIYASISKTDRTEIHDDEMRLMLQSISDDDVALLGFNINNVHPKNLVLTVLPVLPVCNRPSISTDNIVADDDLTIQYIEIIKANKHLENIDGKDRDTDKNKYIKSLKFRVKTLMDNSQGKAKRVNTGRSYQGIKERLSSKTGLVRGNLNGEPFAINRWLPRG
jgi:DNA-directed RNA polymerase beta' subunit